MNPQKAKQPDDTAYCAGGSGVCGCHAQRTPRFAERSRVSRFVRIVVGFGAIAYLLFVAFGCESTKPESSTNDVTKTAAWEHFAQGDYAQADALFREVLALKPADSEARTGRGWSLIHLRTIDGAINVLRVVPSTDSTWYVAARAGLAIAYDAVDQVGSTIAPVNEVLTHDSVWVFFHDPRIDWRVMEYLRARNHLILSSQIDPTLASAVTATNRLTREMTPSVAPLDPVNSATWTANGLEHMTLAEAVLKRLEGLGTMSAE